MKYPRYQRSRSSGIEWIGDVPEGWTLKPLKRAAAINPDVLSEETEPDYEIDYVDIGDVSQIGGIGSSSRMPFSAAPSRARRRVRHGDTVLSTVRTYLKAVAYIESPPGNRIVSTGFACLRPERTFSPKFLSRCVQADEFIGLVVSRSVGVSYPAISPTVLSSLPVPCPPLPEQEAIVSFLDAKTTAIDALIAKKERLLELLEEKRVALITRAVTKGLDPKASMKESGSPWVGRMPEHWRYARVAYVADVFNGSTPDRDNPDYWEEGDVPWLSSGKVNDGTVTEADEFVTQKALRECSIRMMPAGSVLVGMIGQGKTRGMSAFMEMSACINQNVAAVVPRAGTDGRFLHFVFKAAYLPLREFGRGGQQDALNCDLIKAFRIPIPPATEQERIARYLGEKTAWVDELSSKVRLAIDRLREYRTALISAVVTGKIDVRTLTPTAPCQ